MNQILLYLGIGILAVFVCLAIPGLKIIAEAIIKGCIDLIAGLLKHKGTFVVWGVKTICSDHMRVFQHAVTKRDVLDPTQAIRRKEQGYEE